MSRSKAPAPPRSRGKSTAPRRRGTVTRSEDRAIDFALASLAHEIRTPLNGILAFGELLMTADLPERERGWAASIGEGARHLEALTTLVVDAAKADRRGLVLRLVPFQPETLVDNLAKSLIARAGIKGLTPQITVGALPPLVVGDAVRLRAVIENLFDNAVKFTDRGTVAFSVAAKPGRRGQARLVFTVADQGIGLSEAEIRRLFRPFSQASAARARRFGGAGLGLAFAATVAKAMGGTLAVKSRRGRGTTFHFTVQVATDARAAADGAGEAAPLTRPLKVLCAEDNPYGRAVMNAILTGLGHAVAFVGSADAAVEAVARERYDLVLMDVTLGGSDGLAATRRLRALPEGARLPVVGLSGHATAQHEAAARQAGMNAYLVKPVSPRLLADTIAGLTAER